MAKPMAVLGILALLVLGTGCGSSSNTTSSSSTTTIQPRTVVGVQCVVANSLFGIPAIEDADGNIRSIPDGRLFFVWSDATMSAVKSEDFSRDGLEGMEKPTVGCFSNKPSGTSDSRYLPFNTP
jgi:hypothetical protein